MESIRVIPLSYHTSVSYQLVSKQVSLVMNTDVYHNTLDRGEEGDCAWKVAHDLTLIRHGPHQFGDS